MHKHSLGNDHHYYTQNEQQLNANHHHCHEGVCLEKVLQDFARAIGVRGLKESGRVGFGSVSPVPGDLGPDVQSVHRDTLTT